MIFSEDILVRVAIFALGAFGFWVAWYISKHKKPEQRPLVCPLKFDCDTVVHSDYSKFLGIHVEKLGMIYYGFLAVSYSILIFMPHSLPNAVVGILSVLSLVAFLFSLYLIGVQTFILRKGCFWCFVSAFICIVIFLLTVSAYDFSHIAQSLFK